VKLLLSEILTSKILRNFLTMKNSVILLSNFHVWRQEVVKFSLKLLLKLSLTVKVSMKVSMKISRLLDTTRENSTISVYQKVDTGISKISIFPRAIRYDITISNRYFDIFDISKHHQYAR